MALFKYTAKNKEGEIYERTAEVADRLALYKIIRAEGGTLVSVKQVRSLVPAFSLKSLFSGISTQDKINFAKNLAAMVTAGLSVTRSLSVMEKQARSKKLKELFAGIDADISHGITLSEALAKRSKVFSPLFVSMVKAGEESGSVAQSLRIVATQMDKSHQLVKKVRGAMIYPVIIISVMVVLAALLLIFMVPTLTATFEGLGVALPLPTRVIIFLSDFMIHHLGLVLVTLILIVVGAVSFWKSATGHRFFDRAFIRLPVIGTMAREVQVARMARTLSSLLSAGVEIVVALEVTSSVLQNHLYKQTLDEAHSAIQKGESLSTVFGRYGTLFPVFVEEMSAVGEETGKVSEMLAGVADFYENEVDQKTKDLSTIIEPLLMIVIGIGVGFFAISMLAPTYSLTEYI